MIYLIYYMCIVCYFSVYYKDIFLSFITEKTKIWKCIYMIYSF